MAGNIKGITIEFQGDTTKLDKALRQIKNSTKDIDKELKQVNNSLKFNPTNVELWRQKQDLLKAKISETEKNLKSLKDMQAQLDAKGVDKNSEEYRTLQREIIATESKLKTFKAQLREIGNAKLKAVSEQFKQMGADLEQAGQKMKGLSIAAAAVAASIGALAVKSAKWADDMNTMSKVYSLGTSDLQKYAAAANLVDVDVNTIAASHLKLEKQMSSALKGTGKSAEAFETLGVSVTNADGSLRDGDAVWQETIKALGEMTNETERDTVAMQLMGKSASELNPLIEDGGETYKNVADTMSKYGLDVIDQETLDRANEFNDQLDMIKAIGLVTFQSLGTTLAGYLEPALEKVVDVVGRISQWLSQLSPQTLAIIGVIASLLAVLAPVLIVAGKLATGIGAIINLVGIAGPAIGGIVAALGPVILIIGAVIAAGVLLYKNWDKIKAKAAELKEKLVKTFNDVKAKVTAIWNNIKATVQRAFSTMVSNVVAKANAVRSTLAGIFNRIKTAITHPIQTAVDLIKTAIGKIKNIINNAKLQLPKFKLPHFRITGGKLPWGIGGKGVKPTIDVDWYAQGGIFDKASLIGVGEAGSEAVVPLDKFWDKMDKIAEASSSAPIVVNVYGTPNMSVDELASAVQRKIIQMQKQRRLAYQ